MKTYIDAHGENWALADTVTVKPEQGSDRFLVDNGKRVHAYGDEYTALVFAQSVGLRLTEDSEALVTAFATVCDAAKQCDNQTMMEALDTFAQEYLSPDEYEAFINP